MSKNDKLSGTLNSTSEQSVEPRPKFFTVTPKTIRLGHGAEVFQIKNLTRIGKYKVLEFKFPIIFIIILGICGLGGLVSMNKGGIFFGLILLAIAAFGIWQRMQPGNFAFGFECSSGAVRYLYTKDEAFIDKILDILSKYIESEQNSAVQINIEDRSITNTGYIGGYAQSGGSK